MSEHYDTDFDVDRAFADLLEDVSAHTTPPPASVPIRRARARRTTVLAAAASVVVIAGAVAVASGVGRPAAAPGPAGSDLPPAHVLDQAAWNAATAGWVDGWAEPVKGDSLRWANNLGDPTCMDSMPDTGAPEPKRQGQVVLVTEQRQLTFGVLGDFDSVQPADKTWAAAQGAFSGCAEAEHLQTLSWPGAGAESYRLPSTDGDTYLWLAHEGTAISVFWTTGATTTLPQDTDVAVMTAMVAGMQDADSYKGADLVTGSSSGQASGDASAVATPSGSIDEAEFAQALGTWDSGWQRATDSSQSVTLPCLDGEWSGSSGSGFGTSVGSNGDYEVSSFADGQAAHAAYLLLTNALQTCATPYDVSRVALGTTEVGVATSAAGDLWIVQEGSSVGYVAVQDGHPSPPEAVSVEIGKLIAVALTDGPTAMSSASPR